MKLCHELAEYYFSIENQNRNINADISMIHNLLINKKHPRLLDLGCGSGEHLNKLNKLGINCAGIDSSDSMIRTAKQRFPNSIDYFKEDMRSFRFSEEFDIIISLFGSFDYLIDGADVNRVLQNTWTALKDNGIGLFEIWNAIPIKIIKGKPISSVSETTFMGKTIKRERGFKLLDYPGKTIVEVNYNYITSEGKIIKDKHIMRAFTKDEIFDYIINNNFKINALYANSSLDKYNKHSNKIIVQFEKT